MKKVFITFATKNQSVNHWQKDVYLAGERLIKQAEQMDVFDEIYLYEF